jgi:hypothetical protein
MSRKILEGFPVGVIPRGGLRVSGGAQFSPLSLSGLDLWLKADALTLADNDPVGTWTDSSGAGHNATGTGAARPLFKTGIIGAIPVVRFDGSNDYMVATITAGPAKSMYVVSVKRSAASVGYPGQQIISLASGTLIGTSDPINSGNLIYALKEDTSFVSLSGGVPTAANVVSVRWSSAAAASVAYNGDAATAFDPYDDYASATSINLCAYIDLTTCGDYDIGEVIMYSRALSNDEHANVLNYLNQRWGLF